MSRAHELRTAPCRRAHPFSRNSQAGNTAFGGNSVAGPRGKFGLVPERPKTLDGLIFGIEPLAASV